MHPTFTTLLALTIFLELVTAQAGYDAKTNHFLCLSPEARFCAAGSLQGSSIVSCTANGKAEIRSCDLELTSILLVGHEGAAVCYESHLNAGDAICTFNGTGYTPSGVQIDVPETRLCAEDDLPPSVGLGIGLSATAVPSTFQYHAIGQKESARVLSRSDPWSRTGTGTDTGINSFTVDDENVALNFVVVIPTSSTDPTHDATPEPGTSLLSSSQCSYPSTSTSSAFMSQPCPTSPRSSLISTTRTSSTNSSSSTAISVPATLTLYGTPLPGPVGASESSVSNGAEYLHLGGRVAMTCFAMLVWVLVLLGFL
ncbi:hypothetical protein BDW69DRAFT_186416 [Aspergillus filifer]